MKHRILCGSLALPFLLLTLQSTAQKNIDRNKVYEIAGAAQGHVGMAMLSLEDGDTMTLNGNDRFPMQSVFKFPLAIAVLDQVDKGKLALDEVIHIRKEDLMPKTWSPIRDKFPEGTDMKLRDILAYTVSQSDNNGCDLLFRLVGGTEYVNKYIHGLGIDSIAIKATEKQMGQAWDVQYTNWSSPVAMLGLLQKVYAGRYLSKTSNDFLLKVLRETTTCPNRMRGLLPKDAVVAHKTGTSGTSAAGITAATNDVGIVTLPNGKHYAIAVFVSNSKADEATRDAIVAQLTHLFWNTAK
ncbi:class A beta-lactamase, subclass A2 [Chitinophaga sp. S165]|uniref:class A beta-lactamase, subclass A2 n=1 Tax=Chitinophaga sp. S165 TaxID=2135462 RepID=UPI000D7163D0|nr:class A beta-lactamase, subclass A2 [Chitinophaga sp. S165]PWV44870.1 beta-lactamase class A/beta-lactamase class A VEB [Chitinophaga sp. S165]